MYFPSTNALHLSSASGAWRTFPALGRDGPDGRVRWNSKLLTVLVGLAASKGAPRVAKGVRGTECVTDVWICEGWKRLHFRRWMLIARARAKGSRCGLVPRGLSEGRQGAAKPDGGTSRHAVLEVPSLAIWAGLMPLNSLVGSMRAKVLQVA